MIDNDTKMATMDRDKLPAQSALEDCKIATTERGVVKGSINPERESSSNGRSSSKSGKNSQS